MAEKRNRLIKELSTLYKDGMPEFEGKIIHKGPFEFGLETSFRVFSRVDPEGNPNDILFGIAINTPGEDVDFNLLIQLHDPMVPKHHLISEPWVSALDTMDGKGEPLHRSDILAFMINTATDAKLKITTEDYSDVTFRLIFERFEAEATVEKSDIPEIEEFFSRRYLQATGGSEW